MIREARIQELINKYNEWNKTNENDHSPMSCISRDNMRKIKRVFEKEIHEPIENYLK